MPIPLLIGGGILAGKALAGMGVGYGASQYTGRDYTGTDAALDGLLGAASIPGVGATRNATRAARMGLALRGTGLGGGVRGSLGLIGNGIAGIGRRRGAMMAGRAMGMSTIPFTIGGGNRIADAAAIARNSPPYQGPVLTGGGGAAATGGFAFPRIAPVTINYTPSAAPTFNKTLKDYLADKQLQGLVNMQIFQTNKPLLDDNKAKATQKQRNVKQNTQLSRASQQQHAKKIEDTAAEMAAQEARAEVRQQMHAAQTAAAESQVPITYMQGEAATAKGNAAELAANEQTIADSLVDRLATESKQYLEALKAADATQAQVDEKIIKQTADDAIRQNVNQIRANQAQRGTLLGTLAAEQYKNAIDLHNLAISNYNDTENRRYQQAAGNAEMLHNARTANLNSMLGVAEMAGQGSGPAKDSPDVKNARSRIQDLRKRRDTLKTTDPKARPGESPEMAKARNKREIGKINDQIKKIRAKYGI